MNWDASTYRIFAEERVQDWLREAAQERLARQAVGRVKQAGRTREGLFNRIMRVLSPDHARSVPEPARRR